MRASADDEKVTYDCGLYIFTLTHADGTHDAVVDAAIRENEETPFQGKLDGRKKRPMQPLAGHDVEVTVAMFKGPPDTIIQPSVEMYLSQTVDGDHQFFTCFHTLAMVSDEKQLEERLARCVKGLGVLAVASR